MLEEVEHLVPGGAPSGPVEVSIVVPALNEEITVGEFVDWCKEGLEHAGVRGQILIVDSSTDRTPEIVLAHGGEVLRTPKRGLGRAYIDAASYIRGQRIIMGDADLTYDFRELSPFVEAVRGGGEFVMWSRFRGSSEKGAMPGLHRYFGTPLTTWILNRIYGSRYSDIHCGMRGLTRSAFDRIDLKSQSWEYASEMVLKAARLKLLTAEVPVKFYKDREGRFSHHRRMGWLSPWIAGVLAFGPVKIGGVGFSLYWLLFGVTCVTLGYSSIQIGVLARVMHGLRPRSLKKLRQVLIYDRGMLLAGGCSLVGLILLSTLVYHYLRSDCRLFEISHPAIF